MVDASVALAWCFPDEASDRADSILLALEGKTILVPALWKLEVANAILVGERSKRLRPPEIHRFTTLLENLPVTQDDQPVCHCMSNAPRAGIQPICLRRSLPRTSTPSQRRIGDIRRQVANRRTESRGANIHPQFIRQSPP